MLDKTCLEKIALSLKNAAWLWVVPTNPKNGNAESIEQTQISRVRFMQWKKKKTGMGLQASKQTKTAQGH